MPNQWCNYIFVRKLYIIIAASILYVANYAKKDT